MIEIFAKILGVIMNLSYIICKNYGVAIIIFTIISKIILFPINIIIQKNSIKMVKMKSKINSLKIKFADDKEQFMEEQIKLFKEQKYKPLLGVIPLIIQIPIVLGLVSVVKNPNLYINNFINESFCGLDLAIIPTLNNYLIIPILSMLSCILLCYFQNKANVLQRAEGNISKAITTIVTTVLTVYFIFLVPVGVGIYWIIGNILAIIQIYILNYLYPPQENIKIDKKQIKAQKEKEIKNRRKEKYDYKKFFEEELEGRVKLIFYSEQNGFYKYFAGIIKYILEHSNINIYYITSDPEDNIFNLQNDRIKAYYFGKNKLISAFMKFEAKIVVMTTPDLQKFYLKRSLVQKNIEYIYLDHGMTSLNLTLRTGAIDYYDTIFTNGPEQVKELKEIEELRNTKRKNLIEVGFPYLDSLISEYESQNNINEKKTILIAPSHQEDNILESCIEDILNNLSLEKYKIIIRPHPQYIKRNKEELDILINKYKEKFNENFYFELDFTSNETVYTSDLLITDWSGIGMEYSFATNKPTLYINTKMKVINQDYDKIQTKPIDIAIRNKIGKSINKEEIENIDSIIEELILNKENYKDNIEKEKNKNLFNVNNSSKVGAEYIINKINERM